MAIPSTITTAWAVDIIIRAVANAPASKSFSSPVRKPSQYISANPPMYCARNTPRNHSSRPFSTVGIPASVLF